MPRVSTEALSDDAGDVLGPYAYLAFGLAADASMSGWADLTPDLWANMGPDQWGEMPAGPDSLTSFAAFGQKGYYLDAETQLYLLGGGGGSARYYDPVPGRFISQDRIGMGGGDANLFRYCGNDPVNKRDPSGADSQNEVDILKDFPNAQFTLVVKEGWSLQEVKAHQHDPLLLVALAAREYRGRVILNDKLITSAQVMRRGDTDVPSGRCKGRGCSVGERSSKRRGFGRLSGMAYSEQEEQVPVDSRRDQARLSGPRLRHRQ